MGIRKKILKDIVYYGVSDCLDHFGGNAGLDPITNKDNTIITCTETLDMVQSGTIVSAIKTRVPAAYKVACKDTWMAALLGDNPKFRKGLIRKMKVHFHYEKEDDFKVMEIVTYALNNDGILDISSYKSSSEYSFKDGLVS